MEQRLQKIIADAGVASRRKAEELITDGRVSVDGRVVRTLGSKFDPENCEVVVDGETLKKKTTKTYLALNKPYGILSTMSDPEDRPNLGDLLESRSDRLFHVGRLDRESEGLLLLTNDGELAHRATHPSYGLAKNYLLEVLGVPSRQVMSALKEGVQLEDGMARVDSIRLVEGQPGRSVLDITIHDGRNHVLRRMAAEVGLSVERLIRIGMGPIKLGQLTPGKWRDINGQELNSLFKALEMKQ